MTIQNIIDFYFSQYETLSIKVEMFSGISGNYNTYTKEDFLKFINGWNDNEIISVIFETHYTNYTTSNYIEKEIPTLYISYKPSNTN